MADGGGERGTDGTGGGGLREAPRGRPASRPWWVASDLHLGAVPEATARAFHAFVEAAAAESAGLLLNGDVFELWYTTRRFVPREHARTLAVLAGAVRAGLRIVFVGGNRDAVAWDVGVLRDDVGLEVHRGPVRLTLGGWRALVAHGDQAPGAAPGWVRWLRGRVLEHPALLWTVRHALPGARVYAWAQTASATRRFVAAHARGASTGPKPSAGAIAAWARRELAADDALDLVLAGHSHLPALVAAAPGRFYANSGDWVSHGTFVVLPPRAGAPGGDGAAGPELRVWPAGPGMPAWERWDEGDATRRTAGDGAAAGGRATVREGARDDGGVAVATRPTQNRE